MFSLRMLHHTARHARPVGANPPRVEALEDRCLLSADIVLEWNQVLLDTAKANSVSPLFFTRDAAIVSAAVYDAVNDIDRSYTPYFAPVKAPAGASLEAAAAQAAHDTLAALFPKQQAACDATLAADLADIAPGRARLGVAVGQEVAREILAWRSNDGSTAQVSYVPGSGPGVWQPTPSAFLPAAAPQWPNVTPFGIPSGSAFRPGPPPALTSAEYTAAFNEVKSLGAHDSTTRTAEQTQIALFWFGGAGTFTAGGYWDQIAQEVAQQRGNSLVQNARLFALLNIAEADAAIAVWDAKYTYNFWRPVTAIRAADTDGNPDTTPDTGWTPLLVTPNHPSYVSAHSGVSGAAAAALAGFFGTDAIPFSFSSDSLPGVTRSYVGFAAAAQEASDSRVYAGIHWRFDVQAGQALGGEVGDYIVGHSLLPVSRVEDDGGAPSGAAPLRVAGPTTYADTTQTTGWPGLALGPGLLAGLLPSTPPRSSLASAAGNYQPPATATGTRQAASASSPTTTALTSAAARDVLFARASAGHAFDPLGDDLAFAGLN